MAPTRETSMLRRNQFGTFGGVFTPSILTILGVIMFMRAGFITGEAGILLAVLILVISKSITVLTTFSISAISTNMQVRGGGAYFMISRVLGPEFGGAIGIALFFAQALSVPFYILGFTEALTRTFPTLLPYFLWINLATATLLFVIAYISASLAIKAQYVIMTILALSILTFLGGLALRFETDTLLANLHAPAIHTEIGGTRTPKPPVPGTPRDAPDTLAPPNAPPAPPALTSPAPPVRAAPRYSFWILFAIYFPAVTGILAGVNMSGDLKNPSVSIPIGTFCAIGVGFLVYLAQMVLMAGAFDRAALVNRPYDILLENALFGAGFLVAAGVFAATISSALGSYLGAPRILQAVARDRILTPLRPFEKGTLQGDEPRRALILCTGITFAVLLYTGNDAAGGALDAVAAIITMFFMYTYGMINLAAFTEAFGGNPSFRPRFRFFHWSVALLGAIACLAVAITVNPLFAGVSIVLLAGLFVFIRTRQLEATYGDARRGFVYNAVRRNLLRLARMEEDDKNWRPTILAFTGNPHSRDALASYAIWLESGRGIVYLANILVGAYEQHRDRREAAIRQLREFCRQNAMDAFPSVVIAPSLQNGISMLMQSAAVGPIRPNMALFGWSGDAARIGPLLQLLRSAQSMQMCLLLIRPGRVVAPHPRSHKRIDVWWRGEKNGRLMILLAHLLTQNWEWSNMDVRLLRMVEKEAGLVPAREAMQTLIEAERLDATAMTVLSDKPFREVLHEQSHDAACVFLGFALPPEPDAPAQGGGNGTDDSLQEGESADSARSDTATAADTDTTWHAHIESLMEGLPTTILVSAGS